MRFKKPALLLGLLAVCLLTASCSPSLLTTPPETTLVPGVDSAVPAAVDPAPERVRGTASLYFRYLDEPFLAAETRVISQSPSQSWELALLTGLLAGPGTHSPELNALFPVGTRVLSAYVENRTLFVTFSEEVLNALPDEPADWQEYDAWRAEAPLRRRLCMQSLAATVTENCDVDRVQVLVGRDAAGAERLRQNYFLDDSEDTVLALPLTRSDGLLLTPANTLRAAMDLWISRDWDRLYRYIASGNWYGGGQKPPVTDFIYTMESLPVLNRFELSDASVSQSGDTATVSVSAVWTDRRGRLCTSDSRILHLHRDSALWKISVEQLTGWLEGN